MGEEEDGKALCMPFSEQGGMGFARGVAYAVPRPSLTPEYTSCFDYYGVDYGTESENYGQLLTVDHCEVSLAGRHQVQNAATALAAVEVLLKKHPSLNPSAGSCSPLSPEGVSPEGVRRALLKVAWPGRMELLVCSLPHKTVRVLLDGAHNADGMRALAQGLEQGFPRRRLVFCLGMLADKAIEKSLESLLPLGDAFVITRVPSERAGNWRKIAEFVRGAGYLCREEESVAEAVCVALEMCGEEDLLCVAGSLYMLAEARRAVLCQSSCANHN